MEITLKYLKSEAMGFFSKGLKNEFKTSVVNEPSVVEPLKFYSMCSLPVYSSGLIHDVSITAESLIRHEFIGCSVLLLLTCVAHPFYMSWIIWRNLEKIFHNSHQKPLITSKASDLSYIFVRKCFSFFFFFCLSSRTNGFEGKTPELLKTYLGTVDSCYLEVEGTL